MSKSTKSRNFRDYENRLSAKSRLRKLVCIYQIEPYVTPKASIAPNLLICNRLQWNLLCLQLVQSNNI